MLISIANHDILLMFLIRPDMDDDSDTSSDEEEEVPPPTTTVVQRGQGGGKQLRIPAPA